MGGWKGGGLWLQISEAGANANALAAGEAGDEILPIPGRLCAAALFTATLLEQHPKLQHKGSTMQAQQAARQV